jgi:hypothetical protein
MELTQREDIRNKSVSAVLTLLIVSLILLFLFLFQLITPNPPFPESGGGGGMEMALGMMDVGNDVIDYQHMGAAQNVIVSEESVKQEELLTDENSDISVNETNKKEHEKPLEEVKPEIRNNTVVIKPVVKEKTLAEKLAEKYKNQTGKNGGGIGNNDEAGLQGSPDGNPDGNGTGGSGGGTGVGNGTGDGPGSGPGNGPGHGSGYKFTLDGRSVIKPPTLPKDTKEEGKVVVNIVVDSNGQVIEADPNGRGTTTSSALLKAKARQAAMATKFNIDGKMGEQRGTITIIFAFD